jgi:hypothetical protein
MENDPLVSLSARQGRVDVVLKARELANSFGGMLPSVQSGESDAILLIEGVRGESASKIVQVVCWAIPFPREEQKLHHSYI